MKRIFGQAVMLMAKNDDKGPKGGATSEVNEADAAAAVETERKRQEAESAERVRVAREQAETAKREADAKAAAALREQQAAAAGNAAAAKIAAELALADSSLVTVESPDKVTVTLAHSVQHTIPKGISQVPQVIADHWFAKKCGVTVVDLAAVAAKAQREADDARARADKAVADAKRAQDAAGKK